MCVLPFSGVLYLTTESGSLLSLKSCACSFFFFFALPIISVSKRAMLKFPAVFVDVFLLFVITALGGTSFRKTRRLIPKLRNVLSPNNCKEWTRDSSSVVSITTTLIA